MPPVEDEVVIRMPREMYARVEALARSRRCSVDDVLNEAICGYLDEEAWLGDEIKTAMYEADRPDAVFVAQTEVMADLDALMGQARRRCST